jgi:hypothetical protein
MLKIVADVFQQGIHDKQLPILSNMEASDQRSLGYPGNGDSSITMQPMMMATIGRQQFI